MLQNVGIDLVEIKRIKEAIKKWENKFLHRVFRNSEIICCHKRRFKYQHFALKFAAKEAVGKVLGESLPWKDVEITGNGKNKLQVNLYGAAKKLANERKIKKILFSSSYCRQYALVQALTIC